MGNVKAASAATVDDDTPAVPVQAGPVEVDSQVTAEALAQALDPQLVARLAAQARAQGGVAAGSGRVIAAVDETVPGGRPRSGDGRASRLRQTRLGGA
jgi:hypothetical protein